jgi:protein-S-isoprenylcysteine O-methyltransferase Ste14
MRRWTYFLYGIVCYLLFFVAYAYLVGFVGNVLVPKSIDGPGAGGPFAIVIDLLLVAMFGVQHSVMARPWFKERWTRIVAQPIERSTYVLASCIVIFLMVWLWQPIPFAIWNLEGPLARGLLWGLSAAGWLLVPAVSLMIHHFDLFGARQVWLHLRGQAYTHLPFRTPYLYRFVRHPLYLGFAVAFWATPTLTVGHLLFAAGMTLYMAIAVLFEERDLVDAYGDAYREYRQRVPKFIPGLRPTRPVTAEVLTESALRRRLDLPT